MKVNSITGLALMLLSISMLIQYEAGQTLTVLSRGTVEFLVAGLFCAGFLFMLSEADDLIKNKAAAKQ